MGKCCHTNCIQRFLDMFMLLQDLPNFFSELCDKCTCYRYSLLFSNPVPWCFIAIRWHIVFNPLLNPYTNLGQPESGCTKQLAVQWTFGMDIFFFFFGSRERQLKERVLERRGGFISVQLDSYWSALIDVSWIECSYIAREQYCPAI